MSQSLTHIAFIVRDYDEAIAWFTGVLGFTLVADEYQPEQDKRWVLVAPPGASENAATILLARAAPPEQECFIGKMPAAGYGRAGYMAASDVRSVALSWQRWPIDWQLAGSAARQPWKAVSPAWVRVNQAGVVVRGE